MKLGNTQQVTNRRAEMSETDDDHQSMPCGVSDDRIGGTPAFEGWLDKGRNLRQSQMACEAALLNWRRIAAGREADVAELADAIDLGSIARKGVEVRVLSSALKSASGPVAKREGACFGKQEIVGSNPTGST